jgi:hypothetical protein
MTAWGTLAEPRLAEHSAPMLAAAAPSGLAMIEVMASPMASDGRRIVGLAITRLKADQPLHR